MPIKKFLDWRGWLEGLYVNWIKAVSTTVITFIGTNGLDAAGLHGIGFNWKQSMSQLGIVTAYEVFSYLRNKPKPETVEESFPTEQITKP